MSDEPRQGCETPKWKATKRGRRCGCVCTDERGRRRFRFVKGTECGSEVTSPSLVPEQEEVSEFSALAGHAKALADVLGVELERVEPMPLVPLVGLADGVAKRRSRKM